MARQDRGPKKRGNGKITEENGRKGLISEADHYESGEYGDFDDGGYDDEEYGSIKNRRTGVQDEEEHESDLDTGGYDDEDYADYDTSFDEDDASWGRRQQQFEGVTRDERRRKAVRGLQRRTRMAKNHDHRGEFDEGFDSEHERELDEDSDFGTASRQSAGRKRRGTARKQSAVGRKQGKASRQSATSDKRSVGSSKGGSSSGVNHSTRKTSAAAGSRKRASSSSALRTRSKNGSRRGYTGVTTVARKRVMVKKGKASNGGGKRSR